MNIISRPRIFGVMGRGPITVFWTGDPLRPVQFNEGSSFVVSVNGALSDATSVITDIHNSLPTLLRDAVVFELFSGPHLLSVAIEIGSRVTNDLTAAVLESCVRNGVRFDETYRMDEDGRFGYCQRVYVGSLKPSGVLMDLDTISDLLDGRDMYDPKAVAQELIAARNSDDLEKSVSLIMSRTPVALHADVIMEFFHRWRNIAPSLRSNVNDVRKILERDFPQYWEFLRK